MEQNQKSRQNGILIAASDRLLLLKVFLALATTALIAFGFSAYLTDGSWLHDFLFNRRFVQWVLLTGFFIGFYHLVWRIPAWLRERKNLRLVRSEADVSKAKGMVARRWTLLQAACRLPAHGNLGQYAKSLAEHDEAELDAAYRISGDIVQILPLIGFFGTVFGLSLGLHSSFLTEGGTTKAFAQAIAVAFDNTLLGLALTIILFICQSILRKSEEGVLLHLNVLVNDEIAGYELLNESMQTIIERNVLRLVDELSKAQDSISAQTKATEALNNTLQLNGASIFGSLTILDATIAAQTTAIESCRKTVEEKGSIIGVRLNDVQKLLQVPSDEFKAVLTQCASRATAETLVKINEQQIAQFERQNQSLVSHLREQAVILGKLGDPVRDEVKGVKLALENVAATTQNLAERCLRELTLTLAQSDSAILTRMHTIVESHARDLKSETTRLFTQPRKITLVEVPHAPNHDGQPNRP